MDEQDNLDSFCNPYFDYRKLLDVISTRLHKENALRLANLYALPSWYFEIGPSHDPSYALRVLIAMEGKGVFAPDNLKGLNEALKTIEREDLCTTVKDFIKLKYEQGVSQERIRRLTHPQQENAQHEVIPKPRPTSSIVYHSAITSQATPTLFHSPSLGSITGGRHDELDNCDETDGPRSRSRPDLNLFSREIGSDDAATKTTSTNLPAPDYPRLSHSTSKDNLQLILLSAQSLVKQIEVINKSVHQHHEPIQSTPVKDCQHKLINKSLNSAQKVSEIFQRLLSSEGGQEPELMNHKYIHSNSCTSNISRLSSVGSGSAGPERDLEMNSSLREPASVYDKSNCKENHLKKQDSLLAPRPDSMHPMRRKAPPQTRPPNEQGSRSLLSSSIAPYQLMSTSPPGPASLPHFMSRSRHRSKKEDKKTNKHGVLIWNLKVKKLKTLVVQYGSKIESEEFFDGAKRPLRATLSPHGLGMDQGSHMTLMIQCLEEPKSASVSNLEIVVNVIDPHSDDAPLVQPIRRLLERRGIRLVQQFMAHTMLNSFRSTYITITIAVIGRQGDSEDSDGETQEV